MTSASMAAVAAIGAKPTRPPIRPPIRSQIDCGCAIRSRTCRETIGLAGRRGRERMPADIAYI
jgi:hypothetical protein